MNYCLTDSFYHSYELCREPDIFVSTELFGEPDFFVSTEGNNPASHAAVSTHYAGLQILNHQSLNSTSPNEVPPSLKGRWSEVDVGGEEAKPRGDSPHPQSVTSWTTEAINSSNPMDDNDLSGSGVPNILVFSGGHERRSHLVTPAPTEEVKIFKCPSIEKSSLNEAQLSLKRPRPEGYTGEPKTKKRRGAVEPMKVTTRTTQGRKNSHMAALGKKVKALKEEVDRMAALRSTQKQISDEKQITNNKLVQNVETLLKENSTVLVKNRQLEQSLKEAEEKQELLEKEKSLLSNSATFMTQELAKHGQLISDLQKTIFLRDQQIQNQEDLLRTYREGDQVLALARTSYVNLVEGCSGEHHEYSDRKARLVDTIKGVIAFIKGSKPDVQSVQQEGQTP